MDKLVYLRTPKEFTRMYLEAGRSCMSLDQHKGQLAERVYNHTGLLSSCFYAYLPGLEGVAIERDGKLINRGFVYENKVISGFYGDDIKALVSALIAKGYKNIIHNLRLAEPIKVPGVEMYGDWYCPVPYCDFLKERQWYHYNKDTHEWTISPQPLSKDATWHPIDSAYSYSTWVKLEKNKLVPKHGFAQMLNADADWECFA